MSAGALPVADLAELALEHLVAVQVVRRHLGDPRVLFLEVAEDRRPVLLVGVRVDREGAALLLRGGDDLRSSRRGNSLAPPAVPRCGRCFGRDGLLHPTESATVVTAVERCKTGHPPPQTRTGSGRGQTRSFLSLLCVMGTTVTLVSCSGPAENRVKLSVVLVTEMRIARKEICC